MAQNIFEDVGAVRKWLASDVVPIFPLPPGWPAG